MCIVSCVRTLTDSTQVVSNLMDAKSSREAQNASNTRRASLVGCNYLSTKTALKGCVADVEYWRSVLTRTFGFEDGNVTRIVDEGDDSVGRPTGRNIKRELRRIVKASQPGDVVFFHFSGYGAQVCLQTKTAMTKTMVSTRRSSQAISISSRTMSCEALYQIFHQVTMIVGWDA